MDYEAQLREVEQAAIRALSVSSWTDEALKVGGKLGPSTITALEPGEITVLLDSEPQEIEIALTVVPS